LGAAHAVGRAVRRARNGLPLSVRALLQLREADLEDAAVRVEPEGSEAVLDDVEGAVVGQTVGRGDRPEPPVLEADEAAGFGAEPDVAPVVFEDRLDVVAREAFTRREVDELLSLAAADSTAVAPDPKSSAAVLEDGRDGVVEKTGDARDLPF